jgi:hypothetical protein
MRKFSSGPSSLPLRFLSSRSLAHRFFLANSGPRQIKCRCLDLQERTAVKFVLVNARHRRSAGW